MEVELINIADIAARLDAEEKLMLTYRVPAQSMDGGDNYDIRESVLLDVSEESRLFYVKENDEVVWVKVEEAISVNAVE